MAGLRDRTVVLGVTGSVAAYKSADIARRLVAEGALVTVVLTSNAHKFITPMTFTALTGRPALTDPFDLPGGAMPHLELAKKAALILIAPASANTLARLSNGMADDLLSALVLATRAPVFLAPAMHEPMWTHPATKRNMETLKAYGYQILGPATGSLASGDEGVGRLLDPAVIVATLKQQS